MVLKTTPESTHTKNSGRSVVERIARVCYRLYAYGKLVVLGQLNTGDRKKNGRVGGEVDNHRFRNRGSAPRSGYGGNDDHSVNTVNF